ncbi:hypothetical protein, partial [Pseudomonas sp. P7759]|uniref:hypothetical protein n=1 Tax=Pseudomonas sp. P7759 TaxID=2738831 RepID=UPI001C434591
AAKPASLPVYPPNPCRIPASVFDGAPEIKIKSDSLRIVDALFGFCRYRLAGEKREDAVFRQW